MSMNYNEFREQMRPCAACGKPCDGDVCDMECEYEMQQRAKRVAFYRTFCFSAGPETHVFYACKDHRKDLVKGDISCFFPTHSHPIHAIADSEWETYEDEKCYFCSEDEGV